MVCAEGFSQWAPFHTVGELIGAVGALPQQAAPAPPTRQVLPPSPEAKARNRKALLVVGIVVGLFGVLVIGVLVHVAFPDKAEPAYEKCLEAEAAGNIGAAWDACTEAVRADQGTTAAKAATAKLAELQPKYVAWRADQAVKAKAAAADRAKWVARLRSKVEKKYWGFEPDGTCTGEGLPPMRITYEGGSFTEDDAVAEADGCKTLPMGGRSFCCPK
jgi:hypothetical protein